MLYITMSLVLTGMVRYDTLDNAAPVAAAFTAIGLPWVTLHCIRGRRGGHR